MHAIGLSIISITFFDSFVKIHFYREPHQLDVLPPLLLLPSSSPLISATGLSFVALTL
jgi:hypothetical protein